MSTTRSVWLACAQVVALVVLGAEASAQLAVQPAVRFWHGSVERSTSALHWRAHEMVRFTYKQELQNGFWRFTSRHVVWRYQSERESFDYIATRKVPGTAGLQRYHEDDHVLCRGAFVADLGGVSVVGDTELSPEQRAVLERGKSSCVRTRMPRDGAPSWTEISEGLNGAFLPSLPQERDLRRCVFSERTMSDQGGIREVTDYSVSLGTISEGEAQAWTAPILMDAPVPGKRITLNGRSATPRRWRFLVAQSSSLRGYATNADVDAAFFEVYKLLDLRGRYGTMDPDVVFDPSQVEPPFDQTGQWKRPYPGSGPGKWSRLESTRPETFVEAAVTYLDFGAHSTVEAYVAPSGCAEGAWVPVPISPDGPGGRGASRIRLPRDDDGNFMADTLIVYRSLAPHVDADSEPAGATVGDGLTAFEEYRGFVTQELEVDEFGMIPLEGCDSKLSGKHRRTRPQKKDLFVRSPDLEFLGLSWTLYRILAGGAYEFGQVSGVAIHPICPARYVDDTTRIVNFTMHQNPGAGISSAALTQRVPQRGIRLVDENLGRTGRLGNSALGPPRNVPRVAVDVEAIRAAAAQPPSVANFDTSVRLILWHELGHALGIQHHGDGNHRGPIALVGLTSCPPGLTVAEVVGSPGTRVCQVSGVAVQGGENSGNDYCPMKYRWWNWYEKPSDPLRAVPGGTIHVQPLAAFAWARRLELPGFRGSVLPYQRAADTPRLDGVRLCNSSRGTGLNDLPLDQNHAGDSPRFCLAQLRVSDTR